MLVSHTKYLVAALTTIALLTSCAGGSSTPASPTELQQHAATVVKHAMCPCLYVTNFNPPYGQPYSVTVYAAGARGHAKPIQTIAGSNTGLSQPYDIAVGASRLNGMIGILTASSFLSTAGSVQAERCCAFVLLVHP